MKLSDIVYVAPSPIHGRGLFAKQPIQVDSYIGSYQGPTAKRNGTYVLWVYEEGEAPVGRRGLNMLRYLNHSDTPNAIFNGFDLYALKPIRPHEEITFDYEGVAE